jgi:N-acetylneuraminic acid mutarotase
MKKSKTINTFLFYNQQVLGIIFILLISFLSCRENKNTPEYVVKQYLIALKNKEWEKAKEYTTKETTQNLDMMKSSGIDFGITEVKDVKCSVKNNEAVCTFCCSKDSAFYCLDLKMENKKWTVFMPKDGGCRGSYEPDSTNTIGVR